MLLSPMRFKNFVWPHNPRVYSIAFERKLAAHKIPFGLHYLQSLGQTRRVLRGEGEFAGEDAYDTFKTLATVFYEETPGVLVHPVWMTTTAWFAALELRQAPRRDYVAYSFEFWEVEGGAGALVVVPADPLSLTQTLDQLPGHCPMVSLESPVGSFSGVAAPDNDLLGRQLAQALFLDWDGGAVLLWDSSPASTGASTSLA